MGARRGGCIQGQTRARNRGVEGGIVAQRDRRGEWREGLGYRDLTRRINRDSLEGRCEGEEEVQEGKANARSESRRGGGQSGSE